MYHARHGTGVGTDKAKIVGLVDKNSAAVLVVSEIVKHSEKEPGILHEAGHLPADEPTFESGHERKKTSTTY